MSGVYQAKQPVRRFQAGGTANRATLTADGVTMTLGQVGQSGLAAGALTGRAVAKVVAASNASAQMLAAADYLCDGVADEVEINAALASLSAAGGTVLLSEGTFTLAAPVAMSAARQTLRGMGMGATTLFVVNAAGTGVNGTNGIVQLNADYGALSDLTIDGNRANNGAQNNMRLVTTIGLDGLLVERVRCLNSAGYGIVLGVSAAYPANAVIRDCLIENSAIQGLILRAAVGQSTIASGCTVKSTGTHGFVCDSGPVVLSDCHAMSGGQRGFDISATDVTLQGCTAISNGGQGFYLNGSLRTQLTACRAISNATSGYETAGSTSQAQFTGCIATSSTASGHGFRLTGSSTDALFSGCLAVDNPAAGFSHDTSGRASYIGCSAINNTTYGWYAGGGSALIRGCSVVGAGTGANNYGFALFGGSQHVIQGCRVTNMGVHGISVDQSVADVQVVNNFLSSVGLNANATYRHMAADGDRAFINGNMLRDPASGNRPTGGIYVGVNANDSFIGLNDTRGAGVTANKEIEDVGVTTRRVAKVYLDYTLGTDTIAGALAANTPADICPAQTFRVDNYRDFIKISARGAMLAGNTGTQGPAFSVWLVLDGTAYKLGGAFVETGTTFQNPFSGGQPWTFTGLTVGNHTIKVQVIGSVAGFAYLRAASNAGSEFLNIQVTEFHRT